MENPKSILITGASSGIGEALALHYAASGVTLHLCGRDRARLEGVASRSAARGATVSAEVVDVADRDAVRVWVEHCDGLAPLDLVFANAGVGIGQSEGAMEEIAAQTFAINVSGVFHTAHPAADLMRGRRRGQIAIVSSVAGYQGLASAPAYSASKAAVKAYGEALRGYLEPEGVRISVICPGFVVSRITAQNTFSMPFLMPADRAARIIARGLARNRGRITFPWQMVIAARVLANLPMWALDWTARRAPRK
ncbi:SDR family NAD(P)-dependent oxidoreductase [Emcibacter sp. SYSU 3D8]|uniref:SDR family NAD(P)-dependent oxidoreductase n=1 Tax=Emcibacter sp. SYSU 3D8 TaxID=3133969 RepID=UPI0031FE5DCB